MLDWYAFKDIEPTPSAAAIILHGSASDPVVLLGRRNDALNFMGGHYVFPGGRIDDSDTAEYVDGVNDPVVARAIFTTAREVFEETGLLCVGHSFQIDLQTLRKHRLALLKQESSFARILEELQLRIRGEAYIFTGVWVTPAFSPKRYLTHYFLYHLETEPYDEVLEKDSELVSLEWHRPRDARALWHEKKLRISTPIAFVLRHLAEFHDLDDLLFWIQKTPGHDDAIPNRFELRRGIHLIPVRSPTLPPATHTNCVVIGESQLYVVDPGATDEVEQQHLLDHLEHLAALGECIAAVLLTHSHVDHVGTVQRIRDTFHAPVFAHEFTAKEVGFPVDRLLEDGEVLVVPGDPPWKIKCLHTPGHDPGHLCFYESSTRTMLMGDMVANPGTIIVSPDFNGNMNDYLQSLERLLEEEYSFAVPAHGIPFWGNAGKEKVLELIAHRHAREDKIRMALARGAKTLDELLEQVYDDTPREAWPLAEHQLRAHLERMGVTLPFSFSPPITG